MPRILIVEDEDAIRRVLSKIILNEDELSINDLETQLNKLLDEKTKEGKERIVILKTTDEVLYETWVHVTDIIKTVDGVVTLLIEEE